MTRKEAIIKAFYKTIQAIGLDDFKKTSMFGSNKPVYSCEQSNRSNQEE